MCPQNGFQNKLLLYPPYLLPSPRTKLKWKLIDHIALESSEGKVWGSGQIYSLMSGILARANKTYSMRIKGKKLGGLNPIIQSSKVFLFLKEGQTWQTDSNLHMYRWGQKAFTAIISVRKILAIPQNVTPLVRLPNSYLGFFETRYRL